MFKPFISKILEIKPGRQLFKFLSQQRNLATPLGAVCKNDRFTNQNKEIEEGVKK